MTLQISILLGIVAVALYFFARERISADVVGLGVLLSLVVTGLLPAREAFDGFGSDTVIMILGLLILTSALRRTGFVELTGNAVLRHAGERPNYLLFIVLTISAGLGAFISNTASTAFFLPIVFGIAKKAGTSPSKLLMPLAFASILASSVTLISTSTNMVVSGMISKYGLEPMGMFELTPVGLPIAVVGLVYMFTLGRRIIPDRAPAESLAEEFGMPAYLTEIRVLPDSNLVGKTLAESKINREMGITVMKLVRGDNKHLEPSPDTTIEAGDTLLVESQRDDLLKIKDVAGIEIQEDVRISDPDLESAEIALAEGIIQPGSPLIGQTLKGYRFRDRYGVQVLAINHHGTNVLKKINEIRLRMGDLLLLQGRRENLSFLTEREAVRVLGAAEAMDEKRPKFQRAPVALVIFIGAILLVTFGFATLPFAVMLGAFFAFVTGCITPTQAYRDIDWKVIILIGSMLSLGAAMENTGAAKYLAGLIVTFFADRDPFWLLTAFFVLSVILTQPMSNQAAAIVLLPIAIQTAIQADLNPRTFAMMIAVAASASFMTPLEPACLMVYGPGHYRFTDFAKVGGLLTILIYALAITLVPRVWPL